MALLQTLKCLINERLCAATEEIFEAIEIILTEYEDDQALRSHNKQHLELNRYSPAVVENIEPQKHTADLQLFNACKGEVSPEQQERTPVLLHGEPESLQIKEEKEETLLQRPGDTEGSMMRDNTLSDFLRLPVCKDEAFLEQQERNHSLVQDEPEQPQIKDEPKELLHKLEETSLILKNLYADENRETEPVAGTSTEHMKTQSVVEDYEAPQSPGDVQTLSSHGSEYDAEDSDVWETREDESALNSLRSQNTYMEGQTSNRLHQTPSMRNHSGKKQSSCTFPGRFSGQAGDLKQHKPYSCTVCGKLCTQRSYLKVHMRIHTGEKPFTCAVCGKGFGQNSHLKTHMRIHTGERPFICTVCGKAFTQRISLEIHTRTHTREKPFGCAVCEKSFTQQCDLKKHMRTHAAEKSNFICTV